MAFNIIDLNIDLAVTNRNTIRYYDNGSIALNIAHLVDVIPSLRSVQGAGFIPSTTKAAFIHIASSLMAPTPLNVTLDEDETYRVRLSIVLDNEGNFECRAASKGEIPLEAIGQMAKLYMELVNKLQRSM